MEIQGVPLHTVDFQTNLGIKLVSLAMELQNVDKGSQVYTLRLKDT